jgi:hypothetical protein
MGVLIASATASGISECGAAKYCIDRTSREGLPNVLVVEGNSHEMF